MSFLPSSIAAYLPQSEGLLPSWLLFVATIAMGNSVQAYLTTTYSEQVYLGPAPKPGQAYPPKSPVTPLSSRTFGTWCVLQSMVRFYAAYNISNPGMYQMAIGTYAVAWLHFMSEWWIYGTARWGKGIAGPAVIASGSLVWMWMQYDFYVR